MAAVASLTPKLREALLLVEVFGFTYREAAEVLRVPEGTVKSRVFQARVRLAAWRDEGSGAQAAERLPLDRTRSGAPVSCREAMADLSAAADSELAGRRAAALEAHLAACPACTSFQSHLVTLRQRLRFEPVGVVPDVAPRVLEAIRAGGSRSLQEGRAESLRGPRSRRSGSGVGAGGGCCRWRRRFCAGSCSGRPSSGWGGGPGQIAMADLPGRVVAAQRTLVSLAADVSLVERGWHPRVPERRFAGRLRYRAPEHLALELADRTAYPSAAWPRSDLSLVVTGNRWWTRGQRACPAEAMPQCAPPARQVRLVERREPFADATPVPLDLVTPVGSFTPAGAGAPRDPAGRRASRDRGGHHRRPGGAAAGRPRSGRAGNLRDLHPSDQVELWLDEAALVPLALSVSAAPTDERRAWAAARGYRDRPGEAVLELTLSRVTLNRPLEADTFPPPPAGARAEDAGFRDRPATADLGDRGLVPGWLPAGFRPYRAGLAGGAPGPSALDRRREGGPGGGDGAHLDRRAGVGQGPLDPELVRWPPLRRPGPAGPPGRPRRRGRLLERGRHPGRGPRGSGGPGGHGQRGRGRPGQSGGLPARGRAPGAGRVGRGGDLDPARGPGRRPRPAPAPRPAWFAPPAVRVDGRTVTLAYPGPGSRGFLLVQAPGDRLTPPLDDDPAGVRVRGSDGRWSPARGELEWVEAGRVLTLRSATLSLEELLAVAASLEPA